MTRRYDALIRDLGRVKVVHASDIDVRASARVAERVRWLRREVFPRLDADLGVTYPLTLIHPVCWAFELADGTGGMVNGRVWPFSTDRGFGIWAIEISAVVLLEYSDALLEGVLAHEFLHYVWYTRVLAAHGDGELRLESGALAATMDTYRRRDKEHAAEPRYWLTDRLNELMKRVEDSNAPEIKAAHERIVRNWIEQHLLRVVEPDVTFNFEGAFVLDDAVVKRLTTEG